MARLRRGLCRLRQDERGLALIEFAFSVPILTVLFVGGYQTMDAVSAYRKVTTTDRALADLATQNTSLTAARAQQILAASQQIMSPYPSGNAKLRITQVKISASKIATVDWSQALNDTGYTKGMVVTVPSSLLIANTSLVYAEISYQYTPVVAAKMFGIIPLKDTIYMSPRNSASISCSDC